MGNEREDILVGEVTGDGHLVPFTKVGLADVLGLRASLSAAKLIVPHANVEAFNNGFGQCDAYAAAWLSDPLTNTPEVVGVKTIVEAFFAALENPTAGRVAAASGRKTKRSGPRKEMGGNQEEKGGGQKVVPNGKSARRTTDRDKKLRGKGVVKKGKGRKGGKKTTG